MPVERSAGIIFFKNTSEGRKYLVIRSSRAKNATAQGKTIPEFWDFAKGLLKSGEKGIDAARREAKEEVGIEDFELIEDFKETLRYFTGREGKPIPKFVVMFLARVKNDKIILSWEHDLHLWLPYEEAREKLSLPQTKNALDAAERHLNNDI